MMLSIKRIKKKYLNQSFISVNKDHNSYKNVITHFHEEGSC